MAKVVKKIKINNHNPNDSYNPTLDASEYLVEFPDGSKKEVTANLMAESMFLQIDANEHHYQLLKEITDH